MGKENMTFLKNPRIKWKNMKESRDTTRPTTVCVAYAAMGTSKKGPTLSPEDQQPANNPPAPTQELVWGGKPSKRTDA